MGENGLVLAGGDENALKNVQAAEAAGIPIKKFVDANTESFYQLTKKLNCEFDVWQKGSDQKNHFPSSQKLWQLCEKAGDIYKKKYEGLYCVGCETFYSADELNENGECFEHPGKKLEKVSEENYFFRLSKYQKQLVDLIKTDKLQIIPKERKNEILSFLSGELLDISISRSNERAKNWGVPVPGDPTQRIYVWFDALNIYQSGIGFGWDEREYKKWWPADVHAIGKGILRFHAVYWPAFLLSANLSLPKSIFVHGYFTVNGQKMSKSLGNVVDPSELIEKYGADALRYYFLAKFSPFLDGDFSEEKFREVYNADLANGLGNLVARVAGLAGNRELGIKNYESGFSKDVSDAIENYKLNEALGAIWERIKKADVLINEKEVWGLKGKKKEKIVEELVEEVWQIAYDLKPFLPETAEKIEKGETGSLYPRLD